MPTWAIASHQMPYVRFPKGEHYGITHSRISISEYPNAQARMVSYDCEIYLDKVSWEQKGDFWEIVVSLYRVNVAEERETPVTLVFSYRKEG